ncbi:hypothetical protein [Nonomuraea rosea]|uniref:hypothetical protein n=1 Tax=Nonomuraea rosea TaxID=638574 RepID=UPI0031ED6919
MARPETRQPLPAVDVTLPEWAAVRKVRLRVEVVRSGTGRLATFAGAAAAAVGLFTGDFSGAALLATAALSCVGVGALRLWKPDGHQRLTATVLYLVPGASLAALLVAERIVPGIHPGEALALLVWTVGTLVARPARLARRLLSPPPAPKPALPAVVPQVVCDHPAARWWAHTVAVKDGPGPDTALQDIERTGETAMRAIIRSTIPGKPVPNISVKDLSALMDVPEDHIHIGPVPGRGAGVRLLQVGQPDEDHSAATVWANHIAPEAMPRTTLTSVRSGRPAAGPDEEG